MHNKGVEQLKNRFKAIERELRLEAGQGRELQAEGDDYIAQLNYEVGQANRLWNVSPEYDITSHRRWIGRWIVLGKKTVRKFLRWYINPPFDKQRSYNATVTRSLNALTNIVNQTIPKLYENLNEKINRLEKNLEEFKAKQADQAKQFEHLEKRLNDLELDLRKHMDLVHQQLEFLNRALTPAGRMNALDYYKFEQKFRGERSVIKERQKFYLPYFLNKECVLDIGCGRGEFIELLLENGVSVKGIDVNRDMVEFCKSLGFDVDCADAQTYLSDIEEQSLDGIFMAQVAEHLPMEMLMDLIRLAYRALKPGGLFVVETINVRSVYAMSNWFYMDPTHIKPVHPETMKFMMQEAGFGKVELAFLSPVEDRKIEPLHIEGVDTSQFNQSLQQLQDLVYGYQDCAALAYK